MKNDVSKEQLYELHHIQKKSLPAISKATGILVHSLRRLFIKYKIEIRKAASYYTDKSDTIIGNQYRNLTVGQPIYKNGVRKYSCICQCGRTLYKSYREIVHGKTENCRKCFDETKIGDKHKNWNGYKNITGVVWSQLQCSAKKRNHELNISIKYINNLLEQQKFKCALTGLDIYIAKSCREKGKTTASLDRIDSSKGYIAGNVQWVHKDIQWMKQDFGQEEFIKYCALVGIKNGYIAKTNPKL